MHQTRNSLVFERTLIDDKIDCSLIVCLSNKAIPHSAVWKLYLNIAESWLRLQAHSGGISQKGLKSVTINFSDSEWFFPPSFLLPLTSLSLKLLIIFSYRFCDFLISKRKGGFFMLRWLSHLLKIGRQEALSVKFCASRLFRVYLDLHFKIA